MCELKFGPPEPEKAVGPTCISLDCHEGRLFRVAPSGHPSQVTVACLDHLGLGCTFGGSYTVTPRGNAFAWALDALKRRLTVRRLAWDYGVSLAILPLGYTSPLARLCLRSPDGSDDRWCPAPRDLFAEDWVLA